MGWLYLWVFLDLSSWMVVGWRRGVPSRWAIGDRLTTDLPLAALQMVFTGRDLPLSC